MYLGLDPLGHQLSNPLLGIQQLLGVIGAIWVHVSTVGGAGDVDGGGSLVQGVQHLTLLINKLII